MNATLRLRLIAYVKLTPSRSASWRTPLTETDPKALS